MSKLNGKKLGDNFVEAANRRSIAIGQQGQAELQREFLAVVSILRNFPRFDEENLRECAMVADKASREQVKAEIRQIVQKL